MRYPATPEKHQEIDYSYTYSVIGLDVQRRRATKRLRLIVPAGNFHFSLGFCLLFLLPAAGKSSVRIGQFFIDVCSSSPLTMFSLSPPFFSSFMQVQFWTPTPELTTFGILSVCVGTKKGESLCGNQKRGKNPPPPPRNHNKK